MKARVSSQAGCTRYPAEIFVFESSYFPKIANPLQFRNMNCQPQALKTEIKPAPGHN
jgi:hypothetical protein